MKRTLAIYIISLLLIILFTYASLNKIFAFNVYIFDLQRSPFIHEFAWPLSITVPGIELITAGMLMFDRTRLIALKISAVLMLLFTIYVFLILQMAEDAPCTCGGLIRELSWPQHLIFNISFTLLALLGILLQQKNKKIDPPTSDGNILSPSL